MTIGDKRTPRTCLFKRLKWFIKTAWREAMAWKRSLFSEQRELDTFRKCVRLERKAIDYPRAVPLLTELMKACRETGQESRRLDVMGRLRDIEPKPVPDFMWDEHPPVNVWRNNIEAWCAKIERIVKERCMASIHLKHIQNVLRVSNGNATMVCAALENRGVLGSYDMATVRHRVLICGTGGER